MNFFSLLEDAVKKWSGEVAVVHRGDSLRYSDILAAAEFLAVELRGFGVEEGDKVGIMCSNGFEHIVATFAVLRVGAIVFNIRPASKSDEVENLAKEMGLDAFCYTAGFAGVLPRPEDDSRCISIISGRDPLILRSEERRVGKECRL